GLDDLTLALASLHHERRRAVRMNEVATALREHRDLLLIRGHHRLELVLGAAADIEEERNEPDALGQEADHLLGDARPERRIDHADDAAPAGKGHVAFSRSSWRCRLGFGPAPRNQHPQSWRAQPVPHLDATYISRPGRRSPAWLLPPSRSLRPHRERAR